MLSLLLHRRMTPRARCGTLQVSSRAGRGVAFTSCPIWGGRGRWNAGVRGERGAALQHPGVQQEWAFREQKYSPRLGILEVFQRCYGSRADPVGVTQDLYSTLEANVCWNGRCCVKKISYHSCSEVHTAYRFAAQHV